MDFMKIYLRYKLLLIKQWFENTIKKKYLVKQWFENTIKKKYLDSRKYKLFKKKYKNELNALTKNVLSIASSPNSKLIKIPCYTFLNNCNLIAHSNICVFDQDFIEMILSKHFKHISPYKCFICHNGDIYDNKNLTLVMRLK